MSFNNNSPTSTMGGQSLSPSNESSFVPRSSSLQASPMSASEPLLADEDAGDNKHIIDGDNSLIVGATICFTPEPSPRNTPMRDATVNNKRSALNLTPLELDSALSSNATDEYIGSIIDGSKVSSSNVLHTTSSLDGNSTTEYEILDKSLEIEDLDLGEEEEDDTSEGNGGADKKKEKRIDGDVAAMLQNMSPTSSLPSLGSKDGEEEDVGDDSKEVATQLDCGASSNVVSTSSPKVDDRPLTPFNNLHKFWEGQSITNMSKSIMGRLLRQETPPDPVGAHATDDVSLNHDEVHATPAKNTTRIAAAKVNGSICSVTTSMVFSFIVMIGLMTRRGASFTLNAAKYCVQIVLLKDDNVKATKSSADTKVAPSSAALSKLRGFVFSALNTAKDGLQTVVQKKNAMAVDPEATDEQPAAHTPAENPSESKLFSDEAVPDVPQLGLKEDENYASEDVAAEPLDMKELERLRKINSWALHLVATCSKMKTATSQFIFSLGGQFFFSFLLAFIVMTELRMFQRNNVTPKEVVAWENLLCVDTGTAIFDSIPMWEYILSPAAFGAASSTPSGYLVFIFVGMSILASSLFAYWNMKMFYNTGCWNEKEHRQFLKGYAKHGKDWETVAKYVPTRYLMQVRNHGNYWLSIRSPGKAHPFSPKAIKVKKEGLYKIASPTAKTPMSDPVKRVKVLHRPMSEPVKRAKMRLLDKGGQDTSEE